MLADSPMRLKPVSTHTEEGLPLSQQEPELENPEVKKAGENVLEPYVLGNKAGGTLHDVHTPTRTSTHSREPGPSRSGSRPGCGCPSGVTEQSHDPRLL